MHEDYQIQKYHIAFASKSLYRHLLFSNSIYATDKVMKLLMKNNLASILFYLHDRHCDNMYILAIH